MRPLARRTGSCSRTELMSDTTRGRISAAHRHITRFRGKSARAPSGAAEAGAAPMTRAADRDGILKVGPQHYRVFVELPARPDGRRKRESHTVRGSLEQAKAKRAQLLADRSRGLYVGRSEQSLGAYLQSWLDYKRGTVADRTFERYETICQQSIIPALGHVRLSDLSPQHLSDYHAACRTQASRRRPGHTLSGTTINHRHTVLKTALR